METLQNELERANFSRDVALFRKHAQHELDEIRREAAEAYALDSEIDPVPDTAYRDAVSLLETLFQSGIPKPDLSWAEDGSLSFEWYPEEGIATVGVYGDNLVIYTVFFEEKRQLEGICELSDAPMLSNFLATLANILFQFGNLH